MSSARKAWLGILLSLLTSCSSNRSKQQQDEASESEVVNAGSSRSDAPDTPVGLEPSAAAPVPLNEWGVPSDFVVLVVRWQYLNRGFDTAIAVDSHGRVEYQGGPRVALKGKHDFDTLRPGEVVKIWEAINGLGYFGLRSKYEKNVKDVGPTVITVRANGTTKEVSNRWSHNVWNPGDEDLRARVVLDILADYIEAQAGLKP
jgi:hypothetical protein